MNERAEVTYFVEEEPRLRETISAFITSRKMRRGPGALHSRDHLGILVGAVCFWVAQHLLRECVRYSLSVRSANIGKWSEATNDRRLRWNPAWLTFKW
jgi:hypothetical protein